MSPRLPIVATPEWTRAVARAGGQCETGASTPDGRCGARLDFGDRLYLGPDNTLRCEHCNKVAERAATKAKRTGARAQLAAAQDSLF